MRTVSTFDASPLRLPTAAVQLIAARWSAAALALFSPLALLPPYLMPNAVPLAMVLAGAVATLLARFPGNAVRLDLVTPFSIAFAAVGFLYVGISMLGLLPADTLRPVRSEFILRHSYFVFLWIPLMAGTTALFRNVIPDVAKLACSAALPVLVAIAVCDLAAAALWGVSERLEWEGYIPFFDPPVTHFLYALCFFLYVGATRRSAIPLVVVTLHAIVSGATDHGTIYNTMTGNFMLACMFVFALALRRSPALALFAVAGLSGCLAIGLLAGTAMPGLLGFDINTQWRFFVWRENLFAALQSGLLGVGFGAPYFPLSLGNVAEAYRLTQYAEFSQYAFGSPIDLLYIRGQHSSLVNAFYRMGLLGGGLLIAFIAAVLVLAVRAARRSSDDMGSVAAAAGAIFLIEATQIAMHVGIESPRYLGCFALAAGLVRGAAQLAARR